MTHSKWKSLLSLSYCNKVCFVDFVKKLKSYYDAFIEGNILDI